MNKTQYFQQPFEIVYPKVITNTTESRLQEYKIYFKDKLQELSKLIDDPEYLCHSRVVDYFKDTKFKQNTFYKINTQERDLINLILYQTDDRHLDLFDFLKLDKDLLELACFKNGPPSTDFTICSDELFNELPPNCKIFLNNHIFKPNEITCSFLAQALKRSRVDWFNSDFKSSLYPSIMKLAREMKMTEIDLNNIRNDFLEDQVPISRFFIFLRIQDKLSDEFIAEIFNKLTTPMFNSIMGHVFCFCIRTKTFIKCENYIIILVKRYFNYVKDKEIYLTIESCCILSGLSIYFRIYCKDDSISFLDNLHLYAGFKNDEKDYFLELLNSYAYTHPHCYDVSLLRPS